MTSPEFHPVIPVSSTSTAQPQSLPREREPVFIVSEPLAMTLPPEGVHEEATGVDARVQDKGLGETEPEGMPSTQLYPIFGGRNMSHLPTPQSPTNLVPYMNGKSESPINQGMHSIASGGAPAPGAPRRYHYDGVGAGLASTSSATGQMVTPDSSPMVAGRGIQPEHAMTPTKPRRKTPPKTPTRQGNALVLKTETPTSSLGFTPSGGSNIPQSPSPSQLSSPFIPKATVAEHTSSLSQPTSAASPPPTPSMVDTDSAIDSAPVMSAEAVASTRPPGGEIERIRADQARALATHVQETEARRPEYLRRAKRPLIPDLDETGFGIKESPMKGRRIELWGIHETSEESFEERLMAGGYGGYGSTGPAPAERPHTPSPLRAGSMPSSRTLEWANTTTPGPPGSSKSNGSASAGGEDGEDVSTLDEKELKKRRRLEAFRRDGSGGDWHSRGKATLHPVEVEGRGRVLLDMGAEEVPELLDGIAGNQSPARRKGGRRKKKAGGSGVRGRVRSRVEHREDGARESAPLNWPDEEFPWSVRTHERREQERMEEEERMQWIARFLDADSEEESQEEEEDGDVVPMQLDAAPVYPRGRGKMVPLKDYSGGHKKQVLYPSDPADARAALLSKRSVRALAAKRQFRVELSRGVGADEEDDGVVCICRGRDDGRELVQCDDCRTWYHLECLGIKDVAELGQEEDPWYCPSCVDREEPPSEPTFAQVEEDVNPRRRRDPLFFQPPLQESPDATWTTPVRPTAPTTPTRSARTVTEVSTRSSYGETTGSRHGPSTPLSSAEHVRVYTTPGAFEHVFQNESPFDPTSTPSRGIAFGSASFVTPKGSSGLWAAARHGGPGPFVTPTPSKHTLPRYTSHNGPPNQTLSPYEDSLAPSSSPYRAPPYDDTPVDRSVPRPVMQPRRVMDSPSMGRGGQRKFPAQGNQSPLPVVRAKGKERQGAGAGR